jgi:hypothetical protein
MTEYGLRPSYTKLDYHTPFGQHSQTIPTLQWLPTSITGAMGSYVGWGGIPIDAEAMIDSFVAVMAAKLHTTGSFDLATIYNWDTGINKFLPVATKALAVAGSGGAGVPGKAVSWTLNMRTTVGNAFKLITLDYPLGANEFNKVTSLGFDGPTIAIINEAASLLNAWSGRDNGRPNAALSVTFDLNEALQKQYRMN